MFDHVAVGSCLPHGIWYAYSKRENPVEKTKTKLESPIVTTTWAGYTVVDARELVKTREFREFSEFVRRHRSELLVNSGEHTQGASRPVAIEPDPSIKP